MSRPRILQMFWGEHDAVNVEIEGDAVPVNLCVGDAYEWTRPERPEVRFRVTLVAVDPANPPMSVCRTCDGTGYVVPGP